MAEPEGANPWPPLTRKTVLIALLIPGLTAIGVFRRLERALWLQVIRTGRHGHLIAFILRRWREQASAV